MKNKLNLPELESKKVFAYFEELAAIPHGSRNTRQISDYLISFAKEHGLECYQDEANNVVIIQEASAGYESADPIIMQGHMDMVCEKEKGVEIDFEKDGLELYVDGDFLKAKGTTLGGDDGVAVAYILAIMDSPEIVHPRLEAVITVDEEIGMLGAELIDLSMLKGHKMLNIDSDVEGHFLTSCAGGMTVDTVIPVIWQKQQGYGAGLTVTGLEGGHSGSEIDKEHANANILMGRVLKYLSDRMELAVVSLIAGGVILIISGTLLNAFYLLPKYSQLYGMPVSAFIEMGSKINGSIHNLFSFVALAVAPFNLIKSVIDGVVTFVLYKYLSRHLKETV